MTFGVDPLGRLGYAAESLVLNATEFDVAGNDPTILVKWYASTNTYWYKPPNKLTYLNSGHSSASRIVNWLSNVLTLTKGKSIEFKSLGPNDTDQPIDPGRIGRIALTVSRFAPAPVPSRRRLPTVAPPAPPIWNRLNHVLAILRRTMAQIPIPIRIPILIRSNHLNPKPPPPCPVGRFLPEWVEPSSSSSLH